MAKAKTLAGLWSRVVAREHPDLATLPQAPRERQGKVAIDYRRSGLARLGLARLLAALFRACPVSGARLSMPPEWAQLCARLKHGPLYHQQRALALRAHGSGFPGGRVDAGAGSSRLL
ncbi:MAG: hypothetical protein GKR94_19305 [Gammaproteobacteria bacterium]|nr:hypothetical protein [Gammaproteobacteria bacterium]